MSPHRIASTIRREVPLLREDEPQRDAVAKIIEADAPALPVVDAAGKLRGIFGECEFIGALFPGYLTTLGNAGFVPRSLDDALQKRASCAGEAVGTHMNTDHIDVGEDFSDTQLAEIFLHHRVVITPTSTSGRACDPASSISRSKAVDVRASVTSLGDTPAAVALPERNVLGDRARVLLALIAVEDVDEVSTSGRGSQLRTPRGRRGPNPGR
jgi:CBS domain-containing protein